jgi:hypothetical protein
MDRHAAVEQAARSRGTLHRQHVGGGGGKAALVVAQRLGWEA